MEGSSIEMANNAETKTTAILFTTINPLFYTNVMAFLPASACSLSFSRHSRHAVSFKRHARKERLFSVKIKLEGILRIYVKCIHGITEVVIQDSFGGNICNSRRYQHIRIYRAGLFTEDNAELNIIIGIQLEQVAASSSKTYCAAMARELL